MVEHPPGVELHLQGLARPLGVPDHPGLAVAAHRLDRLAHRDVDREVLVRLRDHLEQALIGAREPDVAVEQIEEPPGVEQAVQREVQLGGLRVTRDQSP